MSNQYDLSNNPELSEVIRLKVDGASNVVNTLRDQQTARGLSLICPFPALEVEIPVTFGGKGEASGKVGTIHRIGVEDDPKTGLPRLRLSVRAHNTRATIVAPPDDRLLDEASRMTPTPVADGNTDLDLISSDVDMRPLIGDLLDGEPIDLVEEVSDSDGEDITQKDLLPIPGQEDPAWVGCGELPLPDQISNRARTRRRRKFTSMAAWVMVLGIAAGGVYVLDRAGVVDVDDIKARIAGFTMDSMGGEDVASDGLDELAVSEKPEKAAAESVEVPTGVAQAVAEVSMDELTAELEADPMVETFSEDLVEPEQVTPELELVASAPVTVESEIPAPAEPEPTEVIAEEAEEEEVVSDSEVTVVLPTRWPAEYANAYRLRDPNGVVIDVPGGLVKREGWLEIGKDHPMIRSVKAVQRETGARFVIFINGELPRFMTVPKTGGVAVRLFREQTEVPGETEQVALLDR